MSKLTVRINRSQAGNSCQHEAGNSQHQSCVRRTAVVIFQAAHWTQFIHPDDDYRRREATAKRKCSFLHAWASIAASGRPPTARLVAKLTHICHRHAERTQSLCVRQSYLTGGTPVYRNNRLQYVVRQLNPNALCTEQSSGTSTRNRAGRESLKRTALKRKADTADTAAKTAAGSCTAPFKNENKETASFQVKSTINTQEKASLSELDWSRPVDTPTRKTNTEHTQQSAFDAAVRIFRSSTWFKIAEQFATGLAYFIASRSIRATVNILEQ